MNQNDIEAMIQRYTEAEMAVLDGKSVTFNGQQMTMENLSEIRQGRQEWERRLAALITRRRGHPGYRGYPTIRYDIYCCYLQVMKNILFY